MLSTRNSSTRYLTYRPVLRCQPQFYGAHLPAHDDFFARRLPVACGLNDRAWRMPMRCGPRRDSYPTRRHPEREAQDRPAHRCSASSALAGCEPRTRPLHFRVSEIRLPRTFPPHAFLNPRPASKQIYRVNHPGFDPHLVTCSAQPRDLPRPWSTRAWWFRMDLVLLSGRRRSLVEYRTPAR